ncbi:hypothetical protein [Lacrimispora sp.]|uniref:hypothetical protein n=1 Tax=Lacrimispora sp. TaxID=2719234 RepID=UPI0032E3D4E6
MKITKRISLLTLLLSTLFSFNIFAMNEYKDPVRPTPQNEQKNEDRSLDYRWVWLDDEICVRFNIAETAKKDSIKKRSEVGLLSRWAENGTVQSAKVVTRESYSGKWSQSVDGIRSFTFDDCTIPVGVTKVDGVLYAFNTYGELKAGYEYYTGFKTEADGLVKADSAEFTQWLGTQYLPDCTSHE